MPAIPLYPPSQSQRKSTAEALNPLPQLLQTPSGLAILELQGTINMPAAEPLDASAMDVDDGKLASTPVGRIVFPGYHKDNPSNDIAWMKKVYLYVGRHQRLTGEVKRLQKPMAVIRRREAMEGVMADEEELEIMDIVYYKILFLSRPEPLLALITIRLVYMVVYNVYFHPLSKFAGPWSAAATPMPFALRILNGHIVPWTTSLHRKYGEVVRISPDELSFTNPSAWRDIYGHRPQLPKALVSMGRSINGVLPIIVAHVDDHTRQRKIISPAFSEKALREQEYILHEYTDLLISRLRDRTNLAINLCEWCQFTTFDIMGDLCFGESFKCLLDAKHHPWLKNLFGSIKFGNILTAFQYFPPMDAIVHWCIPEFVKLRVQKQFFFARDKISERIERETDRPDFMSYILQNNEKGYMTREEINASVPILLLGGSDSSALTSTAATFYCMQNPQAMKKLREEIDSAFASSADITVDTASSLPYLHAVLCETLRLFPAAPSAIPREVISGGVTICGQFVPEGTRVGIPSKTAFRLPQNFVDPGSFLPERWLKDADPRFDADRKDIWEPFAYGPRNCVGKPLAWAEMNLIMTKLFWNFEFERAEGFDEDWTNQKVFLGNERTPFMVRLRSRIPRS